MSYETIQKKTSVSAYKCSFCEFATALTFFERSLQFLLLYNFFRKFHALEIHGYTIYLHLSKTKLHYVEIEPYFVKQDEYIDTNGHS